MYPFKIDIDDAEFSELVSMLNRWTSGEKVAKKFGISRNAVWKKIQRLKEIGFEIESRRRKGYRIMKMPDFSAMSVLEALKSANAEKTIRKIYYYLETDSTNNRAKNLEGGSFVVAEKQISGKGRLGREWLSEKGGLYFSFVLEPPFGVEDVPKITLTAGVAVAESLSTYKARLKWPNDVLINGKKVCGILSEISGEIERPKIIVGIGINVKNPVPEGATNLEALNPSISLKEVLEGVVRSFIEHYDALCKGEWEKIRLKWLELSDTIGKKVRINAAGRIYSGKAIGLDYDGGLLIETDEKRVEKIYSGDCFYI